MIGNIYCGYSGVGKSTYIENHKDTATELESSNYKKTDGWVNDYIGRAMLLTAVYKKVFLSAHPAVINALQKFKVPFTLILPDGNKDIWATRLKLRYMITQSRKDRNAFLDCVANFNSDMEFYEKLDCPKIRVKATKVMSDLEEKMATESN